MTEDRCTWFLIVHVECPDGLGKESREGACVVGRLSCAAAEVFRCEIIFTREPDRHERCHTINIDTSGLFRMKIKRISARVPLDAVRLVIYKNALLGRFT